MTKPPTAQKIHAAVTQNQKASDNLAAVKQALGITSANTSFTPQPYPLFLADWSQGQPLVGRVVGWSTGPRSVPQPVVVFEDGGSSCMPVMVDMVLGMGGGGPMWLRDSAAEALAEAKAYVPARRMQ